MIITRGYATVEQLRDRGLPNEVSNDDARKILADAELFVDAFCGPQARERGEIITHVVSHDTESGEIALERGDGNGANYFAGLALEVLTGPHSGKEYRIESSVDRQHATLEIPTGVSIPDLTNVTVRIYQVGEFPRSVDSDYLRGEHIFTVPKLVQDATIAQALYIDAMGPDFFNGDKVGLQSEHVTGYSYTRVPDTTSGTFLSPRARRLLLNGRFKRRTGEIEL